jgi:hypothetical protein
MLVRCHDLITLFTLIIRNGTSYTTVPWCRFWGACEQTVSSETRDVDMGGFTTRGWPDVRRNVQLRLVPSWLETTVRTEGMPTQLNGPQGRER